MPLIFAIRYAACAYSLLLALSSASIAQVAATTEAGRLVADTFDTPALAGNLLGDPTRQPAWIYLPPDYDEEVDRRYPVLYLLHGVLDGPTVWIEPVYQGMTIQFTMDSLIGAGRVREMIVVIPNGRNAYGGSYYRNSATTGNWGDAIARDLVAHVDRRYRTIPEAAGRGIAGHSMGGYGAIHLGMLHPEVFSVVYGINPCCLCCLESDVSPEDTTQIWWRLDEFRSSDELWAALDRDDFWPIVVVAAAAAFSPAPERPPLYVELPVRVEGGRAVRTDAFERWEESNPVANVALRAEALRSLRGLAFDSVFDDEFAHILPSTQALSDSLVVHDVPHRYEVYEGDHRNRMRERMATVILPWISEKLAGEEAGAD